MSSRKRHSIWDPLYWSVFWETTSSVCLGWAVLVSDLVGALLSYCCLRLYSFTSAHCVILISFLLNQSHSYCDSFSIWNKASGVQLESSLMLGWALWWCGSLSHTYFCKLTQNLIGSLSYGWVELFLLSVPFLGSIDICSSLPRNVMQQLITTHSQSVWILTQALGHLIPLSLWCCLELAYWHLYLIASRCWGLSGLLHMYDQ